MKDINDSIIYQNETYRLVFNINVLEALQEEYGSFKAWLDKIAPDTEDNAEIDVKAIKFAYFQMINEGIDIDNDLNGTNRKPVTLKQVGRIFTEVGMNTMIEKLNSLAIASNEGGEDSKNA